MTTYRYTLTLDPDDDPEAVAARLHLAGALGVWDQPDTLVAWFTDRDAPVPAGGEWEVEPERDWQADWKATIVPVRAGDVVIVPSWLEHDDRPEDLVLEIDPGQAFGTGHHATTTLCLELLQELGCEGCSVADIGTGTGVLGIAAKRFGAARVVAVDTDPTAVAVARQNASRNSAAIDVRVGSTDAAGDGPFDLVLANLLTWTLVELASNLADLVSSEGWVIASGIDAARADVVSRAFLQAGLAVMERRTRDGWVALTARHDSNPGRPMRPNDSSSGRTRQDDSRSGPSMRQDGRT